VGAHIARQSRLVAGLFLGLLFFHPVLHAWDYAVSPRLREELKPVLTYVAERREPDDVIYVYPPAWTAYQYYAPRLGIAEVPAVFGTMPRDGQDAFLASVRRPGAGRRFWFIFTHVQITEGSPDDVWFLDNLRKNAAACDSTQAVGASAYLFEFAGAEVR
jgi:hypothetical protein